MADELQPHTKLCISDAKRYAIMPGDWARVDRMRDFLENVRDVAFNREIKSIVGTYKGVGVLCISTGMGGASTGIVVEELRSIGVEVMIRIGSCGALQAELEIGDLIIANGAVRCDGASQAYIEQSYPAIPDTSVLFAEISAAKALGVPFEVGRIRSHDSFYTDREDEIDRYWHEQGIIGSDMETAALFTIGGLRKIRSGSILNVVSRYEGDLADEINAYSRKEDAAAQGEKNEILLALETCVELQHKDKKSSNIDDGKQDG